MRSNGGIADAEKAQFAVSAWLEMDKIEEALNSHTCGIERAFLFQGREYLFKYVCYRRCLIGRGDV